MCDRLEACPGCIPSFTLSTLKMGTSRPLILLSSLQLSSWGSLELNTMYPWLVKTSTASLTWVWRGGSDLLICPFSSSVETGLCCHRRRQRGSTERTRNDGLITTGTMLMRRSVQSRVCAWGLSQVAALITGSVTTSVDKSV